MKVGRSQTIATMMDKILRDNLFLSRRNANMNLQEERITNGKHYRVEYLYRSLVTAGRRMDGEEASEGEGEMCACPQSSTSAFSSSSVPLSSADDSHVYVHGSTHIVQIVLPPSVERRAQPAIMSAAHLYVSRLYQSLCSTESDNEKLNSAGNAPRVFNTGASTGSLLDSCMLIGALTALCEGVRKSDCCADAISSSSSPLQEGIRLLSKTSSSEEEGLVESLLNLNRFVTGLLMACEVSDAWRKARAIISFYLRLEPPRRYGEKLRLQRFGEWLGDLDIAPFDGFARDGGKESRSAGKSGNSGEEIISELPTRKAPPIPNTKLLGERGLLEDISTIVAQNEDDTGENEDIYIFTRRNVEERQEHSEEDMDGPNEVGIVFSHLLPHYKTPSLNSQHGEDTPSLQILRSDAMAKRELTNNVVNQLVETYKTIRPRKVERRRYRERERERRRGMETEREQEQRTQVTHGLASRVSEQEILLRKYRKEAALQRKKIVAMESDIVRLRQQLRCGTTNRNGVPSIDRKLDAGEEEGAEMGRKMETEGRATAEKKAFVVEEEGVKTGHITPPIIVCRMNGNGNEELPLGYSPSPPFQTSPTSPTSVLSTVESPSPTLKTTIKCTSGPQQGLREGGHSVVEGRVEKKGDIRALGSFSASAPLSAASVLTTSSTYSVAFGTSSNVMPQCKEKSEGEKISLSKKEKNVMTLADQIAKRFARDKLAENPFMRFGKFK